MSESYISYRNILSIAWPIILSSLGQNFIYLIDTSFIGRVGEVELGAAAIGGIFYFLLFMICQGLNTGMQVIIARRKGEGQLQSIGEVVDHEIILILFLAGIEFFIMHFLSHAFIPWLLDSKAVQTKTIDFLYFRSFGIFFGALNSCFMAFFIGIGNTRVTVWTTAVMCFVNIILDYLLIFGKYGFPEMGIGGAGLASSIAEACATFVFIYYLYRRKFAESYLLFRFKSFSTTMVSRILNVSAPLVFQQIISMSTWFLFFVLIEHLGERALAISNLVRSLYAFYGISIWALASTTNSMTSNLIGQGQSERVLQLIKKVAVVSIAFAIIFIIPLNLFPSLYLSIYTNQADLILASIPTLRSVSLAILVFSVSVLTIFAVSGTGATRVSLLIELVCIAFYISYVYLVAVRLHQSLPVIWLAESLYWIVALVLCGYYLKYGKWSLKRI